MANYVVSDTSMTSVADKIREKGGTSAPLEYPQGFIDAIDAISGGGDEPIPADGKTRIFIHIAEGTPDNRLTFYLRFTASEANNTTVDWGDGTTETKGSTTATNYSHKYAEGGDYVITMTVNSGTISFEGDSDNAIYGLRSTSSNNYHNRTRIKRIIFGDKVSEIGDYCCYRCCALETVIVPNSVLSIGKSAFNSCNALKSITLPNNLMTIESGTFDACYLLSLIIPDSVVTIESTAFQSCLSTFVFTIPKNVTKIGAYAFNGIDSILECHLKPVTPPVLDNKNTFNGFARPNNDCTIYVPYSEDHSILETYKTATNWSAYASKMQEEPT